MCHIGLNEFEFVKCGMFKYGSQSLLKPHPSVLSDVANFREKKKYYATQSDQLKVKQRLPPPRARRHKNLTHHIPCALLRISHLGAPLGGLVGVDPDDVRLSLNALQVDLPESGLVSLLGCASPNKFNRS